MVQLKHPQNQAYGTGISGADSTAPDITDVIGRIPSRMAFAGGWIDQPFVSRLNPNPPGSMVVVGLQPTFRFMDRAGMATGTIKVASRIWKYGIPQGDRMTLVRELYAAENANQKDPSGSQDMIGLIYPGVNRLDYDYTHEGGYFPKHIETNTDPDVAKWLQSVVYMLPIAQRPAGYNPLDTKCLDPTWVGKLSQSGKDCFAAIVQKDLHGLGKSMNDCMECWKTLLPCTVRHPTISADLVGILTYYQSRYAGAMYSGCGGGYLYVVSSEPVPGGFQVQIRTA